MKRIAISHPVETLSGDIDFYTVYTTFDITPTGNYKDDSQILFDMVTNLVSMRAQPVISSIPFDTASLEDNGAEELSGAGFVWKFAIEHAEAFAKRDKDFTIIDPVFYLKEFFEGANIGSVTVSTTGSNQNIEFKRFEVL